MNEDYKESHEFPSGLTIDYESMIEYEYKTELDLISSQEELNSFVERWRYFCPEIVFADLSYDYFKAIKSDKDLQEEIIQKSEDIYLKSHLNLLLPPTILFCFMKAKKFEVTTGVVVLQLFNSGCFSVREDGTWFLPLGKKGDSNES